MGEKQGNLYKELRALSQDKEVLKQALDNVVNQLKVDFPFNVYFDNAIGGENHYSFCKPGGEEITDIEEITRGVAEWLEKWFYGTKEKNGLYWVNKEK